MPKESLLAATGLKASPVTTATSQQFGDPFPHPARTAAITLAAIQATCVEHSPDNYKTFVSRPCPTLVTHPVERLVSLEVFLLY